MNFPNYLYEEQEQANVTYVGLATSEGRYDFGVIYTNMFFGKPLVVCMQTGRSALLGDEDLLSSGNIQLAFQLSSRKAGEEVAAYLKESLPSTRLQPK
ncbi:DUF3055 domain-containing protein [Thalassobacillus sp. C254]|uniref:DUF3055 domain-containing protein n=1 Tax=Thalassobacillus sp. C254 TaxID=1225341 RepID=UPI0006D2BED7|nr:DUF3055 domain-containing protein [Thalassobacillus sp. C254]